MSNTKISFFLLVTFFLNFSTDCARFSSKGVLLNKDDAIGFGVGCGVGAATFGTLKLLESKLFAGKKNPTLIEFGIATGAALLTGFSAYFIASYISSKDRTDIENYNRALTIFESVFKSKLIKLSTSSLKDFIKNNYAGPLCFGAALEDVFQLRRDLEEADLILSSILEKIDDKQNTKKGSLEEKTVQLSKEIKICYKKVIELKILISKEHEYEKTELEFFKIKQRVEEILEGNLVLAVNTSYEKTVACGSSSVEDLWPLVLLVQELRELINEVEELKNRSLEQKNFCEQNIEQDERYEEFVEKYLEILARIKTEFPLDVFEKRIHEICTSDEYKEQMILLDQDKKHKEIVGVLQNIKSDLKEMVVDVQDGILNVNQNIEKSVVLTNDVKSKVFDIEDKVLEIDHNVVALNDDVKGVKNSVDDVKVDIAKLGKDVDKVFDFLSSNSTNNDSMNNDFGNNNGQTV